MIKVIEIVTGVWDVSIGLMLLICSFAISYGESRDKKEFTYRMLLLSNLFLQISDLLAWIFRGQFGSPGFYLVRISNFVFYISMASLPLTAAFFTYYQVKDSYEEAGKIFLPVQSILAVTSIFMSVINLFTGWMYTFDAQNFYHRQQGPVLMLHQVLSYLSTILVHIFAWRYRNKENATITRIIRITCLLIELAGAYQIFFYGLSAFNIACTAGMLLVFTGILRQRSEIQRMEQKKLEESREKLFRTRRQMLQLQIRPHFMYNTIAAIQAQVLEDQDKAYESIGIFSVYLRDTIHYSATDQLISMEEELNFAERYLELAEMRFGEKLNFEFDIRATDLSVPPFTIQPLIENALNHGLKPFGHKGTICIRSRRETVEKTQQGKTGTEALYVIEVEDNGIGMDPSLLDRLNGKVQNHIGMMNVKQRIELACQGHLEVISPVKKHVKTEEAETLSQERRGTIIRVSIPA